MSAIYGAVASVGIGVGDHITRGAAEQGGIRRTLSGFFFIGVPVAAAGEDLTMHKAGVKEIIAVIADRGADASIRLHEKFGFRQTGAMGRVGYKFDRWLGIVLLQKSLGPVKSQSADARR